MSMYYNGKPISAGTSAYDLAVLGGYSGTESEFNQILATVSNKADKSTTLSGYGITDAYTKTEVDSAINNHKITIDSTLSSTSENPVQNKVVESIVGTLTSNIMTINSALSNYVVSTKSTISIATTAWDSSAKTATISVSGVTADNNVVVSPTPASYDAYGSASIRCTAQTTNSLTFLCKTVPTDTINIEVLVLNIKTKPIA